MIENTISRSLVSGIRGAEQAQRLANPAGWVRQSIDSIAARSATYPAPATTPRALDANGVAHVSLHERCVNTVAWTRDLKISRFVGGALDSVVGSGVHAPDAPHLMARATWRKANLAPKSEEACANSLSSRLAHIIENPQTVGLLGLIVSIAQIVPASVGGAVGSAAGASVGFVADGLRDGYDKLRGRTSAHEYVAACASWGAYFGAGAANLAAATVLPMAFAMPTLVAGAVTVVAPNLALQCLRGANVGIRATAMGAVYIGAAACNLGADAASGAKKQLKKLHMPSIRQRRTVVAPQTSAA